MMSRRLIPTALLTTIAAAPAAVEAAPPRIDFATSPTIRESERRTIAEYVNHYCAMLESGSPHEVGNAREKLLDPLTGPGGVSESFRFEYARAMLPQVEPVIESDSVQATVNAMRVVAMLGTPRALEMLLDHAAASDEENFAVRLWAAKGLKITFDLGTLSETEVTRALRHLGMAAREEPEWLILRRQFEAIASVPGPASREVQVGVLQATTERMSGQNRPSDLMRAVHPAVKIVRDQYLHLRNAEQQSFGRPLAPVLSAVCTIAGKHWDEAQKNETARRSYGGAVQISESLLKLINESVNSGLAGPRTRLGPAWNERDHSRYVEDQAKWEAIVSRPPYSRN